MNKRLFPFLFFITLYYSAANAQSIKKDSAVLFNSISVSGTEGLVIFGARGNNLGGNFWGAEVAYNLNLKNNYSDWVRMLRAKNASIVFSYFNLENLYLTNNPGNKGFLGNDYSLLGSLQLNILQLNKVDLLLTPGLGLTYASTTYQTNNNPYVGSHLNLAAQFGLKLEVPISTSSKLQLGADLFHYSNAAFKLPNSGINNLNTSIGIVSDLNSKTNIGNSDVFKINNKSAFEFGLGIGHRGLLPIDKGTLPPADSTKQANANSRLNNAGFYIGYNYRLNSLLSIRAATDIVYYFVTYRDVTYPDYLSTTQEYGSSIDRLSVGTSIGSDLWLGRFVFEADYGYYLLLKYPKTPIKTYWKFGAKYYLNKWLALEAKEYLHGTEAHYANFGLLFRVE